MITSEENIELGEFLKGKNLPLDLKVEILDHISEQINYKMEVESKNFPLAFSEIKESWKADLLMKKRLFFEQSLTKIHRDTLWKSDKELTKRGFAYFMIFFIISICLIFTNKSLAKSFFFSVYITMVSVFIINF